MAFATIVLGSWFFVSSGLAADGQWQARTQVFLDRDREVLVRKSVRVWDPHPERELEFTWEQPDFDPATAPEIVSGTGRLTWRTRGAADYDRRAIDSVYQGEMRNGRPHGTGSLITRSGLAYKGAWNNGSKHGRGTIRFENGDEYEGDFVGDLMDGPGRYTLADGEVFVGEFRRGLRHGSGVLTLTSGERFETSWRDGEENGRPDKRLELVQKAESLSLRILSDSKANQQFIKAEEDETGGAFPSYVYEVKPEPNAVIVALKSKEIETAWKGNRALPVDLTDFEGVVQFAPVFLVADISNQASLSRQVTRAYIDVKESSTDFQPYLTIYGPLSGCGSVGFDPGIRFANYGWGQVNNSRLTYTFGTNALRSGDFETQLGNFDKNKEASVEKSLRAAGVDVDKLRSGKLKCASESKVPSCLKQIEKEGTLGQLTGRVSTEGGLIFTNVAGRIDYEWAANDGTNRKRTSPFEVDIPLALLVGGTECGAPAPVDRNPKTIELSLDKRDYRVPLNWQVQLAGQQNKRFGFALTAPKSSNHTFTVVLEMADGERVSSPRIELSYFLPKFPMISGN